MLGGGGQRGVLRDEGPEGAGRRSDGRKGWEVTEAELKANAVPARMRHVYESLGLPDFGAPEPALRRYHTSIKGCTKNALPDIPPDMRRRIAKEWRPCFEAWGYPL